MNRKAALPRITSKRQLMLALAAVVMGLAVAAFLLTRPEIAAPTPRAGCSGCSASESASNTYEMRPAPTNTTDANTSVKTTGVSHEKRNQRAPAKPLH